MYQMRMVSWIENLKEYKYLNLSENLENLNVTSLLINIMFLIYKITCHLLIVRSNYIFQAVKRSKRQFFWALLWCFNVQASVFSRADVIQMPSSGNGASTAIHILKSNHLLSYHEIENEPCALEVVHCLKLQSNKAPKSISVLSKLRETVFGNFHAELFSYIKI